MENLLPGRTVVFRGTEPAELALVEGRLEVEGLCPLRLGRVHPALAGGGNSAFQQLITVPNHLAPAARALLDPSSVDESELERQALAAEPLATEAAGERPASQAGQATCERGGRGLFPGLLPVFRFGRGESAMRLGALCPFALLSVALPAPAFADELAAPTADRGYVGRGEGYLEAPDDVPVRFSGAGSTRAVRMSNYCGADADQPYNVPCEYTGVKLHFASLPVAASRPARITLSVLGDHDSIPRGEDDEFIRITVDGHDLGIVFDHDGDNDAFDFPSDRGNLSEHVVTGAASIPASAFARLVADGELDVVLAFLGGSHDDYTPWSGVQEYFELQLAY